LQVAGIYFHAAAGKVTVEDWANGTALYYWLRHPIVGVTGVWARIMLPLTEHALPVALLTWGVVLLEFLLGAAFLCGKPLQRALLGFGVAMHLGILLLHGLVSFALVMMAALVLYLRPPTEPFAVRWPFRLPSASRRGRALAAT
jgi:antimicrobial peptide system SdpB family protein